MPTSVRRTTYPRFKRIITARLLQERFTPTAAEWTMAQQVTRYPQLRLNFVVLVKVFQYLHHFPPLEQIPPAIVAHIRTTLRLDSDLPFGYRAVRTMYDHHKAIRTALKVLPNGAATRHIAVHAVYEAAQRMNREADLINVAIESLMKANAEVPAFSTLDKIVERVGALVDRQLVARVGARLTEPIMARLDQLVAAQGTRQRTEFTRLKELPQKPTRDHLRTLEDRLHWLEAIADPTTLLADVAHSKIIHFAEETKGLDAALVRDIRAPRRRLMLLCLLHQVQIQARDDLILMFRKYLKTLHGRGQTALQKLRERQQETIEQLLAVLTEVLETTEAQADDAHLGPEVRQILNAYGGGDTLLADCLVISAYNGQNYLPLLPPLYAASRTVLFRLLDLLEIVPTTEDDGLMDALTLLRTLRRLRKPVIPATIDLDFANDLWRRVIVRTHGKRKKRKVFDRRLFEIGVFTYLAEGLKTGDLAVRGSAQYADFRTQLLPWDQCEPKVLDFCREVGLASTPQGFVFQLWIWLKLVAEEVDQGYPDQSSLVIADDGTPVLKKLPKTVPTQEMEAFEQVLHARMPSRSVLEALWNTAHWTDWSRHFGPLSGSEPKMANPTMRYLLATFCYGSNLGPAETERHTGGAIAAQTLSTINRQHITQPMLEAARRDIITTYNQLDLPKLWGDGTVAGVDGSQYDLAEDNLIAEYSFRYRAKGGIAYQHISDQYIALFSHFMTCGTWEAIYIIDGLLKNTSEIQPLVIHGDTQAQSTPVFALTYLLGIDLIPRIRNWKGLIFFRPQHDVTYQHIDTLFGGTIDWTLIETHWQDLMQVVISINEGTILASTILRKLRHDSKRNKLYKAFREVGRVIRTVVLLRSISSLELRQQVLSMTNKVEAFNGFAAWVFFSNYGIIDTNDPAEQEKRLHYRDVVANALILQNTIDLSQALRQLRAEGYPVRRDLVAHLSPYPTQHLRRYGDYPHHFEHMPEPIDPTCDLGDEGDG